MSIRNLKTNSIKNLKNPKIGILEQEIENARSKKDKSEVVDLVGKYHKKYYPETTGKRSLIKAFGFLALAEYYYKKPEIDYDLETILPLKPHESTECRSWLLRAISNDNKSHPLHDIAITIWIAYLDLLEKGPLTASETIQVVELQVMMDDELKGQNVAMLLMYYSVFGWICYYLKDETTCLKFHKQAFELISSLESDVGGYKQFYWSEMCLYGYVIHLANAQNVEASINIASYYIANTKYHCSEKFLKKTAIIYRYISALTQQLGEPAPLCGIPSFKPIMSASLLSAEKEELMKKIREILPTFEHLVTEICNFPNGDEQNPSWVNRLKMVEKCYHWYVQVEMIHGKLPNDGIGDAIDRYYKTIEILYRGTTHTFNSLAILRGISHTFFSLVCISKDGLCKDEKLEAKLAVDSYVFNWEKKFTLSLDVKMKEKRDLEPPTANNIKPYLSHRLSGQISQFPDFSAYTYEPCLGTIADELTDEESSQKEGSTESISNLNRDSDYIARNTVRVDEVDGETVPDIVGVLITGMRLILNQHEGDVEMLKEAAVFGEKAFVILTEHGFLLPNYNSLLSQTFQWLGIVYGELSLEVLERDERVEYQNQAVVMLSKAVQICQTDSVLYYQLSLALAEAGQFEEAIDNINQAIQLDHHNPAFYNLLCILLSSQGHFERALQISSAGWNACLEWLSKKSEIGANFEQKVSWENVDSSLKEELLKLTQLTVEAELFGNEKMIENLQKTFVLFRRLIGTVPFEDVREEGRARTGLNSGSNSSQSRKQSLTLERLKHFIIPTSPSSSFIPTVHRFKTYEIHINLWLSVASIYCNLNQVEKANSAVEEAEKILMTFAVAHHRVRHQPSRVFRDLSGENFNPHNSRQGSASGYWNDSDPSILRIQADIALQRAMILHQILKTQQLEKPTEPYSKYISPVIQYEQEIRVNMRKFQKGSFIGSLDSVSISGTINTDAASTSGSVYAFDGYAEKNSSNKSLNAEKNMEMDHDIEKNKVTYSQITHAIHLALLFDNNHLPARTFLGMIYLEKGDITQAEHHLQLSCTCSRHRGSSSGRTGVTSCFGGSTSFWGWYGWHLLSIIFKEQGRLKDSERAGLYALNFEKLSALRGYECLARF